MSPQPRTGAYYFLGYAPPELKINATGAYVDYYVVHPLSGVLKRMRIKLNRIKGRAAQKEYGRKLVRLLTLKLDSGWNPWQAPLDSNDEISPIVDLRAAYEQWLQVKIKHTRHTSPYSYSSMGSVLITWAIDHGLASRSPAHLTLEHAMRFMEHLTNDRGVSNRTWNNYRVFGAMLFSYCVQRGYTKENPFKGLRALKTAGKTREYLNHEDRHEMMNWLMRHEPDFMLPCVLIFGALIRPGELRRLRVYHVDLDNQVITLPAESTKTGVERTPAIPNWMMPYLLKAEVHRAPGKSWLIGHEFLPSIKPLARNTLNRVWVRMRSELGWPTSKQLYSLRDTGIIQLLRDGVDLLHVMQQAGHTEVATTNKYLKHAFPHGPVEVRERSTSLYSSSGIDS